jgi:hypothetical protein
MPVLFLVNSALDFNPNQRKALSMDQEFDLSKLLVLRRVTREITDFLSGQLKSHLATLSPLLQPKPVFGQYLQGSAKHSVKGEAEAFEELSKAYAALAGTGPFSMPKELESPLSLINTSLEVTHADYAHIARTDESEKGITVTSPLRWVLTYAGFSPKRVREIIASKATNAGSQLQQCVLHYLVLHVTLLKRPDVLRIFDQLRFPIRVGRYDDLGELPIPFIECPVTTVLPPDNAIIESTEISGTAVFEEVVKIEDVTGMTDPLKLQLTEMVEQHGAGLLG